MLKPSVKMEGRGCSGKRMCKKDGEWAMDMERRWGREKPRGGNGDFSVSVVGYLQDGDPLSYQEKLP